MSEGTFPYTHRAYFPDEASAEMCAEDLPDYVTLIDPPLESDESMGWLLRAGRDVKNNGLLERHAEVEAIVVRHGGEYDGGIATRLSADPSLNTDPREAG